MGCCVVNTSTDEFCGSDVVVVSYDMLARRARQFHQASFQTVIMVGVGRRSIKILGRSIEVLHRLVEILGRFKDAPSVV